MLGRSGLDERVGKGGNALLGREIFVPRRYISAQLQNL